MIDVLLWVAYFWAVCLIVLGGVVMGLSLALVLSVFRRVQRRREGRPFHRVRK